MGGPEAGPYLRELSDETSRSESSVSLGGGGGSLSGTAGKAGDFLEKNTSYHLGAGRTLVRLALPPRPHYLANGISAGAGGPRRGGGCQAREWGGDRSGSRPFFILRTWGGSGFRNT